MFDFLLTQNQRARREAGTWLEMAAKVVNYRRDQLTDSQLAAIGKHCDELRTRVKAKEEAGRIRLAIESLEGVLRENGGTIYPKGWLAENVEFLLVAGIIILGIRAYILQPFKIPTNSMWPSYYGMTHDVFAGEDDLPNPAMRAFRLLAFGAVPRTVRAPVDGEVRIPMLPVMPGRVMVPFSYVRGRKWLVLPATLREYVFFVNESMVRLRVPEDFDFDQVVLDAFFPGKESLAAVMEEALRAGRAQELWLRISAAGGQERNMRVMSVGTGRNVRAGGLALGFDILTGDNLFVDRVSYHFVRPEVGEGFVFRTGNIAGLARRVRLSDGTEKAVPEDKYYIKRLVGLPGDTLEIRPPMLLRNGAPITGAAAFDRNANREGLYPGYCYMGSLFRGGTVTVPDGAFFALGDNSPNSRDGREWGFIPEADVVGRPLCIYYPFTRRWGLAH